LHFFTQNIGMALCLDVFPVLAAARLKWLGHGFDDDGDF
jgi:hypothetical protein